MGRWGRPLLILIGLSALLSLPISLRAAEEQQPVLKIRGANDAEGVRFSTASSDFTRTLYIDSMNKFEASDLRISVADFVGPDSQLIETHLTVNGEPLPEVPIRLAGLGFLKVDISARMMKEGTYTGSISLIYADKRWPLPIVVTRSRQTAMVRILELAAIPVTSNFSANPELRLTIEETGGAGLTLNTPEITSLVLKEGDKAKVQAQFGRVNIFDDTGQPAGSTFILRPRQSKQMKIRISKLRDTGEFSGTVRVYAADCEPAEQTFTILAKKGWWVAAFFILLGVLPSYLLKVYYKQDRPRTVALRQALRLRRDVESVAADLNDPTDDERKVLNWFRDRLQRFSTEVIEGTEKEPDKVLKQIADKLSVFPQFVNLRRRLYAVQPQDIVAALRGRLDNIGTEIREEKTEAPSISTDITELDKATTDAVRDNLLERLNKFQAEVQEAEGNGDAAGKLKNQVEPKIVAAIKNAQAGDLAAARSVFDSARKMYARTLAEELGNEVVSEKVPPGMSPPDWADVVENVKKFTTEASLETTDPDRPLLLYQEAYSRYLIAIIGALRKQAESIRAAVVANAQTQGEDPKKLLDRIGKSTAKLDEGIFETQSKKLNEAFQDYTAAKEEIERIANEILQRPGVQLGGEVVDLGAGPVARPGAAIPAPASEQEVVRMAERVITIGEAIEKLTTKIKRFDFLFMIFMLCVSILLGLKLLWVDDPTWGGFRAYLTAVLWGLGLYQVSGAAFEGMAGLIEKLSK